MAQLSAQPRLATDCSPVASSDMETGASPKAKPLFTGSRGKWPSHLCCLLEYQSRCVASLGLPLWESLLRFKMVLQAGKWVTTCPQGRKDSLCEPEFKLQPE